MHVLDKANCRLAYAVRTFHVECDLGHHDLGHGV